MDEANLQRRLQKALVVANKLKRKELFEQEVNKELAKRNELLKRQLMDMEEKFHTLSRAICNIDAQFNDIAPGDAGFENSEKLTALRSGWAELKSSFFHQQQHGDDSFSARTAAKDGSIVAVANAARPKSKKRSSLFITVPELMGTSLVRKSVEVHNDSRVAATSSADLANKLGHSLKDLFRPLSPLNVVVESTPAETIRCTIAPTAPAAQNAEQPLLLNQESLGEQIRPLVPLFEHFLVVGSSAEAAHEFSTQLQAFDNDSLSNRLKKTLGGFLNSPIMMGTARSNSSGSVQVGIGLETPKKSAAVDLPERSPEKVEAPVMLFGERGRTKSVDALISNDDGHGQGSAHNVPISRSLLSMFGSKSVAKLATKRTSSTDTFEEPLLPTSEMVPTSEMAAPLSVRTESSHSSSEFEEFVEKVANEDDHYDSADIPKPTTETSNLSSASGKMADLVLAGGSALSRFGGAMLSKLSKPPVHLSSGNSDSGNGITKADVLAVHCDQSLNVDDNPSEVASCSSQHGHSFDLLQSISNVVDDEINKPSSAEEEKACTSSAVVGLSKSELLFVDKKAGRAIADARVIYHYPPEIELPPKEVCDFCLPLGSKLQRLSNAKDEDSSVKEILFGHTHSKRNERCFIFLLEDKTLETDYADEESGVGVSKLYAVCVTFPRLLQISATNGSAGIGGAGGSEFESMVCYAFLTRFPLFDLFFQIIFDMISCERLQRMERIAEVPDIDFKASKQAFEYVPHELLNRALSKLTAQTPPAFNQTLRFTMYEGIQAIEHHRSAPLGDLPEHSLRAADWCLPPFLMHLPPELIVWTLSLLLCEAKVLVVGHEVGMVSCAIMSLLLLLRPLEWVSPVIPLLPLKLMDFIESPVPILAGIILDSDGSGAKMMDVNKILHIAGQDQSILTVVLDVSAKELYLPGSYSQLIPSLSLPDADVLTSRLCAYNGAHANGALNTVKFTRFKGMYSLSEQQIDSARSMHEVVVAHLAAFASLAAETRRLRREDQPISKATLSTGWHEYGDGGSDEFNAAPTVASSFADEVLLDQEDADRLTCDVDLAGGISSNSETLLSLYAKIVADSDADAQIPPNSTSAASTLHKTAALFSYGSQGNVAQQVICLRRDLFVDADEELFMENFLKTQIFSEFDSAAASAAAQHIRLQQFA